MECDGMECDVIVRWDGMVECDDGMGVYGMVRYDVTYQYDVMPW